MWVGLWLLIAFAGDRLFGYGLRHVAESSSFRYSRLYTGQAEADVVLIGNSRGLNFYQPFIEERTGLSTLNLSYNAMPGQLSAALLRDYRERYGAPEVLIADITHLDRDNVDLIREFRVYAQFSHRLDTLLRGRDPKIWGGAQFSHLTRYGGEVAQRMFYYTTRGDEDWIVDRVIAPSVVTDTVALEPYELGVAQRRVDEFADVVAEYRAGGTQVVLVVNPYYPAFARAIANLDSLVSAVERATGLEVLDYSTSVTGDENFGDYQHLNKAGAARYLARLLEDIGLP